MAEHGDSARLVRVVPRPLLWVGVAAGAVAVLLVALVIGGNPAPIPAGLPDPGPVTAWGLPIAKLVLDLAAVAVVGSLVFAVIAPSRGTTLHPSGERAVKAARTGAWVWAAAAAVSLGLTLSDFLGVPPTQVDYQGMLASFIADTVQGRALAVVVVLAVILAATAHNVRTPNATALLLILGIAATLPPALAGHSSSAANHDIATSSLIVHVVAVSIWIGGLGALLVFSRRHDAVLRSAVPKFSTAALWCFVAVAISGVANAWTRLTSLEQLITTAYGRLVIGKVIALVLLGGFGWWHRRATLPGIQRGTPGAFRRFGFVEAGIMVATVALAVALSRTAPPAGEELRPKSTAEAIIGYAVPPISPGNLVTLVRVDVLVVVLAGMAIVGYLRGVWRLRTRGIGWPVGRTISWIAGVAVTVIVLCSGIATYAPALFSVHMVQHMVLGMLAPILLAMAAPVTLALRALPARPRAASGSGADPETDWGDRGLREWLLAVLHSRPVRVLTFPPVALGVYVVSLYAFYFSPTFVWAMQSHLGHLAMVVHFLAAGALYFVVVMGLDPLPRKLPAVGRLLLLFASLPFHAFFGVIVMTSTTLIGAEWYSALRLGWVDPLADQNVGGGIAWATAEIPTLLVLGVIFIQWLRSDAREARRFDRRVEAGTDEELSAYNAWLAQLAARDRRQQHPHPR
ncbi:MAG TPA: bifunctional copper resistance protein CopD/cytochrome c oxidase assembly protein [Actinopolymorphaceae bacterium]|jgi:putative copper resistance protein D